jgi:hypothetical protein
MPGAYVRPLDIPTAPSRIPAATNSRCRSISAAVGGRSAQPMASIRTVPWGTR